MVARSAFALVAVLFAFSHCAIDDRDLEEHGADDDSGGSSNGGTGGTSSGGTGGSDLPMDCQPDGSESDCLACEMVNCCDELVTCYESLDCLYYIACGGDCTDASCLAICASDYPEGANLYDNFYYCGQDRCEACLSG